MANTTGNDKLFQAPFSSDPGLYLPAAIPAANTTFYAGQAVGRDASGNMVQMDDTAKAEFIGILDNVARVTVNTTDAVATNGVVGDKMFNIHRPAQFTALIASAAAGQEGKRVYFAFNNQVSLTPGNNCNFAGTIIHVKDSTHVVVSPPWVHAWSMGGLRGVFTAAAAAGTTLTKWDVNKLIILPLTSGETITFPAANATSPGDELTFVNTSSNSSVPTFAPAGTDHINGSGSSVVGSDIQYSMITFRSDGNANWYVSAGAGGNQNINGTLTVTSTSANALAVGPNGATNPTLNVDASTTSDATGLNVKGAAAGAGLAISVISSGTPENLTIDAKGTGTVTINGTATGTVVIGSSLTMSTKNMITDTTTGTILATTTTQKLGFFGKTPVVQPLGSADATTAAAGSGTTVFLNTTFVGAGPGTAAYTIGGIVTQLKLLGLLAA